MDKDFDLKSVVAFMPDGAVNPEAVLGKLCWFTISKDIEIEPEVLQQLFKDYEIDEAFLPPALTAQSSLGGAISLGKMEVTIKERKYNLEFREIYRDDYMILHVLNKIAVDRQAIATTMTKVGQIAWQRDQETELIWEVLPEFAKEYDYDSLFKYIQGRFDHSLNFYTGSHIGTSVKKIIKTLLPISARSTGAVYIIPREHMKTVEKVEDLIHTLDTDYRRAAAEGERLGQSEFNSIYILNTKRERLLIRGKLEEQVQKEMDKEIEHLAERLKDPESRFATKDLISYASKLQEAQQITGHYEKLLRENFVSIDSRMQLYEELVRAALDRSEGETTPTVIDSSDVSS